MIAQIIIEEEEPFFDCLDEGNLIQKIHLFTTILGNYSGRNGINVDRLDWIVRDTHHANLIYKLDADNSKKYEQLIDYIKHDKYKIKIKDNEFFDVDNEFNSLLHNVRENIYSNIFEGPERSFIDSL